MDNQLRDVVRARVSMKLSISLDQAERYLNMPLDEQSRYVEERTGRSIIVVDAGVIPSLHEGAHAHGDYL